jgi:hypothetical protein
VDALQEQFSRESPVYAKPKSTIHAGQTLRPVPLGHAAKPPLPISSATSTTPIPRAGTVAHVIDQRPSLPPKPGSIGHGNFVITSPGHPHASSRHSRIDQSIANSSSLANVGQPTCVTGSHASFAPSHRPVTPAAATACHTDCKPPTSHDLAVRDV